MHTVSHVHISPLQTREKLIYGVPPYAWIPFPSFPRLFSSVHKPLKWMRRSCLFQEKAVHENRVDQRKLWFEWFISQLGSGSAGRYFQRSRWMSQLACFLFFFLLAKQISSLNLRSLKDTHGSSQAPAKFLSVSPSDNVTPHTPPLLGCRTLAITSAEEEARLIKSGFNTFPSHCQSNSFPVKPNHI